jgi:DNA-binding protein H-NS
MTTTYKELLKQRDALEQAIAKAREQELAEAMNQARQLIAEFGLTAQDLFPADRGNSKLKARSGAKVAAKYRDSATGQTWTGRGKAPKWIDGKDRTQFLIA